MWTIMYQVLTAETELRDTDNRDWVSVGHVNHP